MSQGEKSKKKPMIANNFCFLVDSHQTQWTSGHHGNQVHRSIISTPIAGYELGKKFQGKTYN